MVADFKLFVQVALVMAACCLTLPAAAQQPEQGREVLYVDLSQAEQIGVIRTLVENGQVAQAQLLLNGSIFDERDYRYQAAYLQAIIYRVTGRLEEASVLLRQILAEQPEFRLVRLELAQVLALMDQTDGAQFHLNILAEAAENAGEREFFEAAIDAVTPDNRLSFSTFLTIAPSTNLNSGAGQRTVVLDFNGQPLNFIVGAEQESGVGVSYGGTAIYAIPMIQDRQLYFAGAAQINDYPNSQFDNQILTGRVGMHFGPPTRRATVELVSDQRWVDGNSFDSGLGARIAGRLSLGDGMRIQGEYSYTDRDFRRNPDQINQNAEVTLHKALSARQGVSFGVLAGTSETLYEAESYDALGFELRAYRGFANGMVLDGSVEFRRRTYRGISSLVGGIREDDITRLRISALSSRIQFRGVTPRVSLTWTNSSSNDVRYDYEAYGAEFSLTTSF